jgi:hypothetical protein
MSLSHLQLVTYDAVQPTFKLPIGKALAADFMLHILLLELIGQFTSLDIEVEVHTNYRNGDWLFLCWLAEHGFQIDDLPILNSNRTSNMHVVAAIPSQNFRFHQVDGLLNGHTTHV